MVVRTHGLIGADDDQRQAAFARAQRDLVRLGLGAFVLGHARHLPDEGLVARLDAGAPGGERGGDVDRARHAELECEPQGAIGSVDVRGLHPLAQRRVGAEFVNASVVDHEVRARHGRAHRFALRDVARYERGAERSEVPPRRAVRAPYQRVELPAAAPNDSCERLADKARAAGEKDAHTDPLSLLARAVCHRARVVVHGLSCHMMNEGWK